MYYIYTGVEDYTSGPFPVEFNAEDMSALFNVSISNDNILEGSESFNLIIDSSSITTK